MVSVYLYRVYYVLPICNAAYTKHDNRLTVSQMGRASLQESMCNSH